MTAIYSCQAVFLIDTFIENLPVNYEQFIEEYCKTISLSTLRILSYLSLENRNNEGQKRPKASSLKWGYKFFDSRSHSLKVEKYSFKELKLKHFEEFEREIQRRIKILVKNNLKSESLNHSKTTSKKTDNKISQCDCFTRTLSELIDDYEWETPDLFSPIKRRKLKKRNESKNLIKDSSGNFAFLFSICPKSATSLRQFAKKKVLDSSVFLDSLMPASLFSKFCEELKLKFFWIDTDKSVNILPDFDSLQLVQDALEKTKGNVIPIDSILQYGKEELTYLTLQTVNDSKIEGVTATEEDKREGATKNHLSSSILPFTTIFNYYLSKSCTKTSTRCKSCINHECFLEYKDIQICKLDISVTHTCTCTSTMREKACTSSEKSVINSTVNLPHQEEVRLCYKNSDLDLLHNISMLQVHSVLKQTTYLQTCSSDKEIFVCVGTDIGSNTQHRSQRFQKLLCHLLKENVFLVLLSKNISKFLLLKPLTATSATLTVMSTGVILQIEKQLLGQTDRTFTSEDSSNVTEAEGQNWHGLMSRLCSNKLSKVQKVNYTEEKKNSTVGIFNPRCADKSHLPGYQPFFISLIDKLNDRISQLEFLSDSEVKTLKKLQKMYHVESRPPKLINHTPQTKGPELLADGDINSTAPGDITDDNRKDSVQSRGQMILTRSKQAIKEKVDEPSKVVEGVPVKSKPVAATPANFDFKNEEELKDYLSEMYNKSVNNSISYLYSSIQPLVTIALHYMRESGKDNPQESCEQLLKTGIVLMAESLRQKYQNDTDIQLKIREYQLQIILRLEIQSMVHGGDQNTSVLEDKVEEIVTLLRTISFITEPKILSEFMKTCLVENFVHNLPQMLGCIYDELMQPYPKELESVLSPDQSTGDSSVFNQSLQSCGGDTSISQPVSVVSDVLLNRPERNSRSRKLVHHPSLADFGPKRQIVVSTKTGKEKNQKSDNRQKKKEKEKEKRKLERRQSVAVMETVKTSTKKRSRAANMMKSPKFLKSPNRKLVSETPAHKQKKHNMWKRLEKERRRTHSVIDIKVVAESPVKSDLLERDSPSQKKRALTTLRRSFYSAGPINRSRSLTNSLELADRIAGRNSNYVKKTKRQSLFNLKSPDRNSSFLLSQLMGSPESIRKTPGKKISQCRQSPSQNTPSKTQSKGLSSQKSLFKEKSPKRSIKKLSFTPVKNSSSQDTIIPDSPCLNTRSHTPSKILILNTPSKSPSVNTSLLLSPSQSTRSKVTATPTRHSVKAKLFFRSPEQKLNSNTRAKIASPNKTMQRKRSLNLDEKDVQENKTLILKVQNQTASKTCLANQNEVENVKYEGSYQQTEKTPSPTKKLIIKTPNSIDSWPRKKKWTKIKYGSNTKKRSNDQECVEEDGLVRGSNVSSSDDEFAVRINDQIDLDERLEPDIDKNIEVSSSDKNVPNKPRISSKRSLTLSPVEKIHESSPKQRRCLPLSNDNRAGNNGRSLPVDEVKSGSNDNNIVPKLSRKRNLILSPEKCISSPNKRQRISLKGDDIESSKMELPMSFSLHSHILTRNFSNSSEGVLSSQGFDTSFMNSQGSAYSKDILSVTSTQSMDYFSVSNDEVFLSPSKRTRTSSQLSQSQDIGVEHAKLVDLSENSNIRSDSPVFGSSKENKSNLQNRLKSQETDNHQYNEETVSTIKSPCTKIVQSDDGSTIVSPSTRKYSPSVSAKSLCHLISSPILNSPAMKESKEDGSPKIDQDSLNIRRKKMSGRIRRSLMQN